MVSFLFEVFKQAIHYLLTFVGTYYTNLIVQRMYLIDTNYMHT